MDEIRRLWQEEWAAQGAGDSIAKLQEAWSGLWQAIAADPGKYWHIPFGWACILVYLLFWGRRKKKFRREYGLEIARGKYFWLRLLAGMTMMAPGVFGQFFFAKTFDPIWEGPYKYPVWIAMAAPFALLLILILIRDMGDAGVPVHLQVTTVIYSYMSSIVYAYVWLISIAVMLLVVLIRVLHGAKLTEGEAVCPQCGHALIRGRCRNCAKLKRAV